MKKVQKKFHADKNLRSMIFDLHQYTAGKSIEEIAHKYKINPSRIIKLGSNENVLGSSIKAKAAATSALEKVNIYPDVVSEQLSKKIKKHYGLKNNIEVVVGNGMDHVFEMLARLFLNNGDETVISVPTFSCYELTTLWSGAKPKMIPLTKDYQLNVPKILSLINKKTKIIFICSPNNPTGNLIKTEDIKKILDSTDKIVFLDEAYTEFAGKSLVNWIEKYPNLIIGRTFSKIYGLAGFRVGYAFIHKTLAQYYLNAITPFAVSRPGQAAALAALDDSAFVNKTIKMVKEGRDFYYKELTKSGIKFLPSDANFITINTALKKSKDIALRLLEKGIIVRECSTFGYGGDKLLRITIGTREQNQRVLNALREII